MLIGFCGKKGAGKNAAADALPDFRQMAFADPLKNGIKAMFGFTHPQLYGGDKGVVDGRYGVTPRSVMQFVGTELMRNHLEKEFGITGLWVKRFCEEYDPEVPTIVTDVRFEDEAQALRDRGGVLLRIERPGLDTSDQHESEQGQFEVDVTLVNDSTIADLQHKVCAEMRKLSRKR